MFGRDRHQRFIAEFQFPAPLLARFTEEHEGAYSGDVDVVVDGLRQWFEVCRRAGNDFVAMPSEAVDAMWHEFILFTRAYGAFCDRAFGRFLHHTPTVALGAADPDVAIAEGQIRTWLLACAVEDIDPDDPRRLPWLFAADEQLGWAGGNRYNLAAIRQVVGDVAKLRRTVPVDVAAAVAPAWASSGAHHTPSRCAGGTQIALASHRGGPGWLGWAACGTGGDGGGGCGGGGCGGG